MGKLLTLIPIPLAFGAFVWYASPSANITELHHRTAKLYHDRIEPSTFMSVAYYQENTVIPIRVDAPCKMKGRIKWNGSCWLPSRIPAQ